MWSSLKEKMNQEPGEFFFWFMLCAIFIGYAVFIAPLIPLPD
jgi:hypothetical protein